MRYTVHTDAAEYPVSLAEMKMQLRLTSGTLADNITTVQSIAPGSHGVAAAYSLVGTGVDVLGYDALVNLVAGANGSGGTVDVKIQHSDTATLADYTDWTGGAFTQVTVDNDNAVQEKQYTGGKQYIRVLCTVANAACEFGVNVIKQAPYSTEDDLINACIAAATEHTEDLCGPLVQKVYDGYLDDFPAGDTLTIPKPRCSAIESIKYTDEDGTEATVTASEYLTDFVSRYARARFKSGYTWPTVTLRELNAVVVRFTAGYASASVVPDALKAAIKLLAAHLYENRELIVMRDQPYVMPAGYDALIINHREWGCPE